MPLVVLEETVDAAESRVIKVTAGMLPLGVRSWGLTGTEVMTIQEDRGDGTFRAVTGDGATMTATDQSSSITATGDYKITKPLTASPAGVAID